MKLIILLILVALYHGIPCSLIILFSLALAEI